MITPPLKIHNSSTCYEKNVQIETANVGTPSDVDSVKTQINIPIGQTETDEQAPIDNGCDSCEEKTNAADTDEGQKTTYTRKEFYNAVKSDCDKYNITEKEVNDILDSISNDNGTISKEDYEILKSSFIGVIEKSLDNVTVDKNDIANRIREAFSNTKDEKANNVFKQLDDSRKGFYENLRKGNPNITEDELLEKWVEKIISDIKANKLSYKYVAKYIKRYYAQEFADIVKKINNDPTLTNEEKTAFTDELDLINLEGANSEDIYGVTRWATSYQSEDGRTTAQDRLNKYYTDNKDIIESAKSKIEAGEALTAKEKRVYDYFVNLQSGSFIGHGENEVISKEFQIKHGIKMDNDAHNTCVYENILININDRVSKIQNADLFKFLDKITNKNLSIVKKAVENNTKIPELNKPLDTVTDYEAETSSYDNKTGEFKQADVNPTVENEKYLKLKDEIAKSDMSLINNTISRVDKKSYSIEQFLAPGNATNEDIDKYIEEKGETAVYEIFNSNVFHRYAYEKALIRFEKWDKNRQEKAFEYVHKQDSIDDMTSVMSTSLLEKILDNNLVGYFKKNKIKNVVEFREKQNGTYNKNQSAESSCAA